MANDLGFACTCCGGHHGEPPMHYTAPAPPRLGPGSRRRPRLTGITMARVREIAETVLHGAGASG